MPQVHPGSRDARPVGVIHLTTSFPLTAASASGSFVARLVDSLPAPIDSTVLVPAAAEPLPAGAHRRVRAFRYAPWRWQQLAHAPGGVPVALARQPLLYLLLPVFMLAMAIASVRALRTARLIHAHWSVNGVIAGGVARLLRKPCVTTLWGEDVTRSAHSMLYRGLLWLCLWLSHRTVSVSQAMHQQMLARFPKFRDRLRYIPNGVEPALAEAPAAGRDATAQLRVLYVGSLIPRKSVDVLVAAWAQVAPAERAGWQLTLVGAGAEEARLRAAAQEHGFAGQVRFAGMVPPDAVAQFYRDADVFVLPSRSEGMPSVVLEAMAAGLPIVATDIDGVRELVGAGREGLLFPVGDATALAQHLRALARDAGARRRMGAAARSTIMGGGFLWPAVGRQYAELYAGLAGP